ncbi:hypothetical protein H0H92_010758 [Tricholoma furcatifolium]|nr:hypothetical protein H0H92_010758 [Tricholoma furcatifolium]
MEPQSQHRRRSGIIRYGHPSPERCKYPSDNENDDEATTVIEVSSGEEAPPPVSKKAKAVRTVPRSLNRPAVPLNVVDPALLEEARVTGRGGASLDDGIQNKPQ